jgi:phage tail sheath protein FI
MSKYLSPGVYPKVSNISQITALATSTTFATVVQASRGAIGPRYYGTSKSLLNALGNPNQNRSVALWGALAVAKRGGGVWVNNIAGTGATAAYSTISYNPDTAGAPPVPVWSTAAANNVNPDGVAFAVNDVIRIEAVGMGSYYAGVGYRIMGYDPITELLTLSVFLSNNANIPVETHVFTLRDGLNAGGVQQFAEDVVNGNSLYINVRVNPAVRTGPSLASFQVSASTVYLAGGVDGAAATAAQVIAGWEVFKNRKLYSFNVAINGGDTRVGVRTAIDNVMATRGSGIALLDLDATAKTSAGAVSDREVALLLRSRFSALFGPRYKIYSPYEDRAVFVPASGGAAAAACYSDSVKDVWWAFAGVNRGVVPDAIGLEVEFESFDLDIMYPKSINTLISEQGAGVVVFGNRTLLQDSSSLWSINVQRLVSAVQDSAEAYLRTELFEQNDDALGRAIETNIGSMLRQVKAGRGLYKFAVVSNTTNNSGQDIDEGIRNVAVYLQPTRSAEIIVLDTILTRTGADFNVSSSTDNSVFGQ